MKQRTTGIVLSTFVLLSLLGLVMEPPAAEAQAGPPWTATANSFAQAVSSANPTALQAASTPLYWDSVKARFNATPAPAAGELGILSSSGMAQNGAELKSGYAQVHLLCKAPSGLEEFVTITLKLEGGQWKVCGGWAPH